MRSGFGGRVDVGVSVEDLQRLQQRRALRPGAGLRDRVPAELDRDGCLVPGLEAGEVERSDHAGVVATVGVAVRCRHECRHSLCHGAGLPLPARCVDACLAADGPVIADAVAGADQRLQDSGISGIAHDRACRGDAPLRHPQRRGGRPVLGEQG